MELKIQNYPYYKKEDPVILVMCFEHLRDPTSYGYFNSREEKNFSGINIIQRNLLSMAHIIGFRRNYIMVYALRIYTPCWHESLANV